GWFFCLLGGAFLLIPCHILITRKGWQPRFSPLVFSYVALMFLFATLLWFLFFVH
ncbi:YtcA family lipoprotein, partial [Klebsiella pneumoniae]